MSRGGQRLLDTAGGLAGAWLAGRISSAVPGSPRLLVFVGLGLAASACFLLPYRSMPSPIQPVSLWKPAVYTAFTLVFTFGSALVSEGIWRSRRSRPVPDGALREQPSARVLDLAARGRKIEAIRVHREETGLGLREAKDAVDRALEGDPHERRV